MAESDSAALFVFDGHGPDWTINTGTKTGSTSRISYEPSPLGKAVRFDVVVSDRWEAFKSPIPDGRVPAGHDVMVFHARTDGDVHAIKTKLGDEDGTWWEATAMVGADWTTVVLSQKDFSLVHAHQGRRAGSTTRFAQAREIQFEGALAGSDRYTFWLADIRITSQSPEAFPERATVVTTDLYHPPGMWTWDNWFAHDGQRWHAFYLQLPQAVGVDRRWKDNDFYKHVGHATSTDLYHWQNQGPALCALSGTWNDRQVATGSIARHEGRWWMLYTGHGNATSGIGLAVSDDLTRWDKIGDGPVIRQGQPFDATWDGCAMQWTALADPYVYPEPIDGWFYMVINAQIVGAPPYSRGCLTTMRSRDLRTWEPHRILAWPKWFARMETPQIWQRNGIWYLYFGGVRKTEMPEDFIAQTPAGLDRLDNYYFMSRAFEGPYEPGPQWRLRIPDPRFAYICKILRGLGGQDVMLTTIGAKSLSPPFPVKYHDDGTLSIGPPVSREETAE